jgi:hypothetical protein
MVLVLVIVLVALLVAPMLVRRPTPAARQRMQLLRMAMGDEELVARLIDGERALDPAASEDVLVARAVDRWQRANR